jgi:invasion protein IalB
MPSLPIRLAAATALGLALAAAATAQEAPAPADEAPATEPSFDAPAPTVEENAAGDSAAESDEPAAEDETPETEAPAGDAAGDPAEPEVMEIVRETHGEWEVRCTPEETDCFLYQLALDDQENPVAEFSLLKLPAGSDAVAGATVVTPLGTLLPEGIVIQIDGGEQRQYPFAWCSQVGCFARFGLTGETINAMKRGRGANVRLVSVAAPEQPVSLDLSLSGFTAAYDALAVPEAPSAAPPAD